MGLDSTLPSRYSGDLKLAILSLLNSMGAVSRTKAITVNDIARYLNMPLNIVEETIYELLREKYIEKDDNTYYISKKGIAIVVGVIS